MLTSYVIIVEFVSVSFRGIIAKKHLQITVFTELFLPSRALRGSPGKGTRMGFVVICLADKLLHGSTSQTAAVVVCNSFFPFILHISSSNPPS